MARTKEELEQTITQQGLSDAGVNAEYNRLTGNKSGASTFYNSLQNPDLGLITTPNIDASVIPTQNTNVSMPKTLDISNVGDNQGQILSEQQQTTPNINIEQIQPTQEIKQPEVVKSQKVETKTPETPEVNKLLQGQEIIDLYKKRGSKMPELENIIEAKYPGTTATQVNGGIEAVINGEKFRWENNEFGDPVKTSLGRVDQPVIEQNEDVLFANAIQGGVLDQNNPKYADVQKRVDKYNLFTRMSDKDIQNSLGNGLLLPGTTEYNDLMKNPEQAKRIKQAEQLNIINGKKADEQTLLQNKSDEILTNNKVNINGQAMTLKQAMDDGYVSDTEYADMTSSPEIKTKTEEVQKRKDEVATLQAKYDAIEDTIEAELKGQGAVSKRAKEIMIMNEKKRQLGPLNLAITLANNSIGTLTELENKAAKLFTLNYDSYKDQKASEVKKLDLIEERKYNAEQQKLNDERSFENQKELLKIQQEYKDKDIQTSMITDPATGKQSLINSKTGEVIKEYDTGLTPTKIETITPYQQAQIDLENRKLDLENPTTTTTGTNVMNYDFIKKKEGFSPTAYQDSTGKWTIGYGFTTLNGKPVKQGDTITKESADAQLPRIAEKYSTFKNLIKIPLSEAQKTALTSFEYNLGQGIWTKEKGGAQDVINKINQGDFAGAGKVMLAFNKAKNPKTGTLEVLNGLTKRRQEEANMLMQGVNNNARPLTDRQYTQYNQATSKFVADPGVKSFESALSNGGDLIASLNSSNGPGDVGAVFQFMKTLDPASTVREGEFALAAKSAGVWEQFKNIPANKLEGTILTDKQRKAFGKLAFEYIKNKSKLYDIKYNDYIKILKNQGIPETYYPTKMSDMIHQYSDTETTGTTAKPAVNKQDVNSVTNAYFN